MTDAPITADLDFSKLNSRIEELHDALQGTGGDVSTIFEDEARLFLKQVIRLTPPKTKQQGEAAIDRDLMRIFEPVNDDFLDDMIIEHGANNIDTWLTTTGGERKHIKWTYADNTGGPMANFHHKNQDSRGRTYRIKGKQSEDTWYAPYVVGYQNFTAYAKRVKSHVGRRKAAWAKSYEALGGKVASWINGHVAGAKGEYHNPRNLEHPEIVMINRAPGIERDMPLVRSAIRIRQAAIARKIKLVLSGYSKDVSRGLKIQRQAHKTPESFSEA